MTKIMNKEAERINSCSERKLFPHVFIFGDRTVSANVISCHHGGDDDARFILSAIDQLGGNGRTLFVEQGSSATIDNGIARLRQIAQENPEIGKDFFSRQKHGWSFLDEDYDSNPYALAANRVFFLGGKAVNMDADFNFSPQALNFLFSELPIGLALEILYTDVKNACFSMEETVPKILEILLPQVPKETVYQACRVLYETHDDAFRSLARQIEYRELYDFIREKYMLLVLEGSLEQDDIVLTHPIHIRNLTENQCRQEIPQMPKLLFRLG